MRHFHTRGPRLLAGGSVSVLAGLMLSLASATMTAQTERQPDWTRIEAEAMTHYQALLRIDTADPPGREAEAVAYLKQLFETEGIPVQAFALEAHRPNLIARLKGSGRRRPLLLLLESELHRFVRFTYDVTLTLAGAR